MKDSILLILAAVGVSALAWGFWRYFGDAGSNVVSAIAVVVLTADNIRLRRQLRLWEAK